MKKHILAAAAIIAVLTLGACGDSNDSAPQITKASGDQTTTTSAQNESADVPAGQDSGADSESSDSTPEESKLQSLADQLMAAYPDALNGSVVYGSELFEKNCKKLYACEITDLTDGMIVFNNGGGLADEISIVFPADGDTDKQLKMLEARKEMRYNDFNGYAPEELPKIEAGKTFSAGGAAVLIISDNADELEKIVKDNL